MRLASLILALAGTPAFACDTALALAIDVSGSVSKREYAIQTEGLAVAFLDEVVAEALVSGQSAVLVVQWTGLSRQAVTLDWRRIGTHDDVVALAEEVRTMPREWDMFSTAIGDALAFTVREFDDVADCERRIIDISSDGTSNEGMLPQLLGPTLDRAEITVNALVITGAEPNLPDYFRQAVIHGPGAFVEVAAGYEDYPRAIRSKLLQELTVPMFKSVAPAPRNM
ncbi:DUF1194 domain-containing protein [Pelagovum pacificum]|uniref:DUF1194 domain-containing protein n=1 Tax=Pelagovum pacificum TaxID=2588711 RepID=A0A5C5G9T0_9RHOB|nr:DUF1194 domain-containing protein [Pelagovum pacificum]QQA42442.1 DUF1194 domain-containing protein [Pelagovum pacificum]TNY31525.1 DUF1194 domain-containing protein [Pelagovum pacificum]